VGGTANKKMSAAAPGATVQVRRPAFTRPANDNPQPWHRPLLRAGLWVVAGAALVSFVLLLQH